MLHKRWNMSYIFLLLVLFMFLPALLAGCGRNKLPADALNYSGPVELHVKAGESLPGTNVKYIGINGDKAHFQIGEFSAEKLKGDSLTWHGKFNSNLEGDLSLRLIWFDESVAYLGGTVNMMVRGVHPEPAALPGKWPLAYSVPVHYTVKSGKTIPGTTIGYVGKEENGAKLSGVSDYPYRNIADSITWSGHLAPNVNLNITLRVIYFTPNSLQLAGIAAVGTP